MTNTIMDAMKSTNGIMEKTNEQMDVKSIQQMIKEFAKNSDKLEMKQDMVSCIRIPLSNKIHYFLFYDV